MNLNHRAMLAISVCGMLLAGGGAQATAADAELLSLVERHARAQGAFDQATLRATTTDNYVEISPVGEVDSREKMLSFYAPELKRPAPQVQLEEPAVRIMGDTALVSVRLSYSMSADGGTRKFALRGGYVARLVGKQWLLVSAQYTGIRPPQP